MLQLLLYWTMGIALPSGIFAVAFFLPHSRYCCCCQKTSQRIPAGPRLHNGRQTTHSHGTLLRCTIVREAVKAPKAVSSRRATLLRRRP